MLFPENQLIIRHERRIMKKKKYLTSIQPDISEKSQELKASESILNSQSNPLLDREHPFRVVGIGASAGGLEALELFLKNVLPGTGMAFVIVQHLDPTHKGIMVELLQRTTLMPVIQVKDRLKVKPDCVYVIPPNKDMSILHGVLYLLAPSAPRGLRLPIDYFFRSLADDLQEHSVGVILSGMGSDGTLGLRAIKEKAGVVFVQTPASAKFDSMPRSAIDAGLADVVAPVEELPGRISAYIQHFPNPYRSNSSMESKTCSALEKIFILLRMQTGHDFSLYKRTTIYRRVERRMGLHQIDKIANYLLFLQENPQEIELLFKELLVGVTSFFRDPEAWDQLQKVVLPAMLLSRPLGGKLRAWTPGCSTGEEAYSLAILFRETLEQLNLSESFSLQVFATDLDRDAIEKARQGIYPANIAADVSPERLKRFFLEEDHSYRVSKEIREMVIFAPQNLVMDPPFTRLDLLTCRNLLIYLDIELQKKLIPLFYHCLNPGGVLFLGNAETIGTFTHLFILIESRMRLYQRINSAMQSEQVDFPPIFFPALPDSQDGSVSQIKVQYTAPNLQSLADQVLLQHFTPAAVLVNSKGDILYINGRTGKYLELATGKANWNIFAMAREGLNLELYTAFQKMLRQKESITLKNIVIKNESGVQVVDIILQYLKEPEALRGMVMIVFREVAVPAEIKPAKKTRRVPAQYLQAAEMEKELTQIRWELQTTREEMQTSQEELKSANEELQSTNEELQSTNEELTTSREEMQSMNEELQTVNHELQSKVKDLSHINNDMENLLNSTDIAILFLDEALHVRRFTRQAAKIIKFIPGDVGRPITDIASDLLYPELAEDAQEVLRSLAFTEKSVASRDGRWFIVRIMPYRTKGNMVDGVVITITDFTVSKKMEETLQEAISALKNRLTDQITELNSTRRAEKVLQEAQAVLEKRLDDQAVELYQARVNLSSDKEIKT